MKTTGKIICWVLGIVAVIVIGVYLLDSRPKFPPAGDDWLTEWEAYEDQTAHTGMDGGALVVPGLRIRDPRDVCREEEYYIPDKYAIRNGSFKMLQSGEEIYVRYADALERRSVWVHHNNKCYFVDESGCKAHDIYAFDGFYAGSDGSWDMDVPRLKELCRRMEPTRKRWVGQLSIHSAKDDELLALMARSGCAGVLIGFESLDATTLAAMGKRVNTANSDYAAAIENLRRHHLSIYATFVFGYDGDTHETFRRTYDFAMESRFFFAAFNHLVPFPGTDVYARFVREGRMLHEKWWLDKSVHFGDVVFRPRNFTPDELAATCEKYRLKFYSLPSILKRGMDFRANTHGLLKALYFFASNLTQEKEVLRRKGLPNGGEP